MADIPTTLQPSTNYDDTSTNNPALKNTGTARAALGWGGDGLWQTIRPNLVTYILAKDLKALELTKRRSTDGPKFDTAIGDYIKENLTNSSIPQKFLFAALKVIILTLRNNDSKIAPRAPKIEDTRSQRAQTSPAQSVPPESPLQSEGHSKTPRMVHFWVQRVNDRGVIRSGLFPLQQFTDIPNSQHPSDIALAVMQATLLQEEYLSESMESIHYMGPDGLFCTLTNNLMLKNCMQYVSAHRIADVRLQIRGSNLEDIIQPFPSIVSSQTASLSQLILASSRSPSILAHSNNDGLGITFPAHRPDSEFPNFNTPSTHYSTIQESVEDDSNSDTEGPLPKKRRVGESTPHHLLDDTMETEENDNNQKRTEDSQHPAGMEEATARSLETFDSDDTAELMNGSTYNSEDVNATIQNALDTEACAQVGEDDFTWKLGCQLFKRSDPTDHSNVKVGSTLLITFFPYQIICVMWMLLQAITGCPGGFVADEMGYGKTIELLLYIYVCCLLVRANADIKRARSKPNGGIDEHLPPSTPGHPQDPNARCPSDKFDICCPCQEWSISYRLKCKLGPHLIVVLPSHVDTWVNNFFKMFGRENQPQDLTLGIEWHGASRASLKRLAVTDELRKRCLVNDKWKPSLGQENIIILSTTNGTTFQRCLYKKEFEYTTVRKTENGEEEQVSKTRPALAVCWASVSLDEAHTLQRPSNFVMKSIAGMDRWFYLQHEHIKDPNAFLPINDANSIPIKWFLTGTPWERSPLNMEAHLHCLRLESWFDISSKFHGLTAENFQKVITLHTTIVKAVEAGENISVSSAECRKLISNIRRLLPLFMIRRTDETKMWGERLLDLPPLHVAWRHFNTPLEFQKDVALKRARVAQKEIEQYRQQLNEWRSKFRSRPINQRPPKPSAPTSDTRKKAPNLKLRTIATFPALVNYLYDDNGELIPNALTIDDMEAREGIFLRDLNFILDNSPKYQELLRLIDGTWPAQGEPGHFRKGIDKLVTVSGYPICAWLIDEGLRKRGEPARLFISTVSMADRDWLAVAFQEDPDLMLNLNPAATAENTPYFLDGSSQTLGLGLTLTKAHHLVKMDVDFLEGHDRQIVKRIWRIGQTKECHVWRFITTDNTEEVLVQRRQAFRGKIVSKSFAIPTADYNVQPLTRDFVDLSAEV